MPVPTRRAWPPVTVVFCLAAALLVGTARGDAISKPTPVRVYVFTAHAAGQETAADEQGRNDSVADLKEALSHRRSDFIVVSTAGEAQVTIEVVDREERDTSQGGFGGKSVSRFRTTLLRVRVKAGEDASDLKGVGQGSWTSAAKDAAERLAKWTKNHGVANQGSNGGQTHL